MRRCALPNLDGAVARNQAFARPVPKPAIHFVGFRGDEYGRACRVFGRPDFLHMGWDRRAQREIADDDLILFARGEHDQLLSARNFDDICEAAL